MRKSKLFLFFFLLTAYVFSLYLINRDLFHFSYNWPYGRSFTPEENGKENSLITDTIPLKKGSYQLSFSGSSEGTGSGCYLINGDFEVIYSADIPAGEFIPTFDINLDKNASVRVGISYDPAGGKLETGIIRLSSDHVLYRESILRHLIFSFIPTVIFIYIALRLLKTGLVDSVREKTGIDLPACEKSFLFLLILTFLASWPLLDITRFTKGDDFYFHASRIQGMAATLKAGYFPPRILLGWMENYGVGAGFYYPDLFLIPFAFLCMNGITAIDCLRLFLSACTFFSLLSIYLAAKNIGNGSKRIGRFAAVLYAFAAYRLICIFYRNAVGEVQAFIFFPLVLWGLIEILKGNTGKWKIFAFGFFGLLGSHMISLAISGILCALCLLFFVPHIIRNKSILLSFIKAAAVTILAGAFFLLPMAEQALTNELQINVFATGPFEIKINNLMPVKSLFLYFDPWNNTTSRGYVYPGFALLLVPVLRLILLFRKKTDRSLKTADCMMAAGVFLLIVSTDLFPWQFFTWLLRRIQFCWRFFGPASVLICVSGAVYCEALTKSFRSSRLISGIFFAAAVLSGFPILIHTFDHMMYPVENLQLTNRIISGVEYIPPTFDYLQIDKNKDRIFTDDPQTVFHDSRRKNLGFTFSFERESSGEAQDYSVPLIYYYGYTAELTDENGEIRKIPVTRDSTGLVRVNDEGLRIGTFDIAYRKTNIQKAGELISLLTLLALLLTSFRKYSRRSNNN